MDNTNELFPNIEDIADTRPTPDMLAATADEIGMSDVQLFARALAVMPANICLEVCRTIGGLASIDRLDDIAKRCNVSTRTIQRYIASAASEVRAARGVRATVEGVRATVEGGPPMVGTPQGKIGSSATDAVKPCARLTPRKTGKTGKRKK